MTQVRPRYQLVAMDCPDPLALADFYSGSPDSRSNRSGT